MAPPAISTALRKVRRKQYLITIGRLDQLSDDDRADLVGTMKSAAALVVLCVRARRGHAGPPPQAVSYTAAVEGGDDGADEDHEKYPHLHLVIEYHRQVSLYLIFESIYKRFPFLEVNLNSSAKAAPVANWHCYLLCESTKKTIDPAPFCILKEPREKAEAQTFSEYWLSLKKERGDHDASQDLEYAAKLAEDMKSGGLKLVDYLTDPVCLRLTDDGKFTAVLQYWKIATEPEVEPEFHLKFPLSDFREDIVQHLDNWYNAAFVNGHTEKGMTGYMWGPPSIGKTSLLLAWAHDRNHNFVVVSGPHKEWSNSLKKTVNSADLVIWEECDSIVNAKTLDEGLKLFLNGDWALLNTKYGVATPTRAKRLIITSNHPATNNDAIACRLFVFGVKDGASYWKTPDPNKVQSKSVVVGNNCEVVPRKRAYEAMDDHRFNQAVETQLYKKMVSDAADTRFINQK
jgi:hypothetical protein